MIEGYFKGATTFSLMTQHNDPYPDQHCADFLYDKCHFGKSF